jgi:hypothetical protein
LPTNIEKGFKSRIWKYRGFSKEIYGNIKAKKYYHANILALTPIYLHGDKCYN